MNIYDKITSCEKIACFIEGPNINNIVFLYKKDMLKSQFYDVTLSTVDNCAKTFLINDVLIYGYETLYSKEAKPLFSGSYAELQKTMRSVI